MAAKWSDEKTADPSTVSLKVARADAREPDDVLTGFANVRGHF
jgi:hypothetical protein